MKKVPIQGWIPAESESPTPVITFTKVNLHGLWFEPNFGDRHSLLILKRQMPKKVSFIRAYRGWIESGRKEEKELGEGRAFLRWLMKHELSIDWKKTDFISHPFFSHPTCPKHDPFDEMAQGLSFAIKPISVGARNVKLYVRDDDMLNLISLPYGNEFDFLEMVQKYISQRFEWEGWRAPAPPLLDWVKSMGMKPVFQIGQVGLNPFYSRSPVSR